MTFSPNPPTVAGAYWWKEDVEDCPLSLRDVFKHRDALVVRIRDGDLFTVQEFGGLWCRLVPVDGYEAAFREGHKHGHARGVIGASKFELSQGLTLAALMKGWEDQDYYVSHARKVVEGGTV